jgi:hypothetical protein
MQLNVLRSTGDNGNEMMKLVRYSSAASEGGAASKDIGSITDGL